jgi:hypothetical protein
MYKWTPDAERLVLLTALKSVKFQPSRGFYDQAAQNIGGGVTADGVRYRFSDPRTWPSEKHWCFCLLFWLKFALRCFTIRHPLTETFCPISQRFYKLKKESEALTNGTATTSTSAPTTTPATPKKPRAAPGTGSGRKRKTPTKAATENGTANGDDEEGSASKRTKTATKKKPAAATSDDEVDGDGDEDDGAVKKEVSAKAEASKDGGPEAE